MKKNIISFFIISVISVLTLNAYEVMVFGDFHFDRDDLRIVKLTTPKGIDNAKRNDRAWESANTPKMLQCAVERAAKGVDFVVQLGDIIHGHVGTEEGQIKMLEEAWKAIAVPFTVPFYYVQGNHEIYGKGGKAAFQKGMMPYVAASHGNQPLPVPGTTHFAQMHKGDLFIFFDCAAPNVDFVENTLNAHPEARNVFLFTHIPLIPCGPSPWIVYQKDKDIPKRHKLLSLLAKRNAIVLAAHVHNSTFLKYKTEEGTIAQYTSFSMIFKPDSQLHETYSGNGASFLNLKSLKTAMGNRETKFVFDDFKFNTTMTEYRKFSPAGGFSILKVEGEKVSVLFYRPYSQEPVHEIFLKGTL